MKNKKAFAMIEMLLVVGLLSTMFSMYYTGIYKPQKRSLDYEMSLKRELSLREFTKNYIILTAEHNVTAALTSPVNYKSQRIEPLDGEITSNKTTTFALNRQVLLDNKILKAQLKLLRCHYSGSNTRKSTTYDDYICETGENGTRFLFETDYNRATGAENFNNIYDNVYPIFAIDKVDKKGISKYGSAYSKKFTFVSLYDSFREKSFEKLKDLKNRLLDFHKKQLLKELRNNCSSTDGGLDSWDDTYIPWIWLVNSTQSKKYQKYICSSSANTCKCTNLSLASATSVAMTLTGLWQTKAEYMSYYSSDTTKWSNMLKNLNLPTKYYTVDSVGNFFKIVFFSDGDSKTLKYNSTDYTPPPKPTEYYNESNNYTYKVQGEINIVKKTSGTGNNSYNNASTLFLYE